LNDSALPLVFPPRLRAIDSGHGRLLSTKRYPFNMPEELTAVQLEYRRRRLRIWKSAGIFILLPVGILVAVNQLALREYSWVR
jgi:hypothetical protein